MFFVVDKLNDMYLVLDTEDGTKEYHSKDYLINAASIVHIHGVDIKSNIITVIPFERVLRFQLAKLKLSGVAITVSKTRILTGISALNEDSIKVLKIPYGVKDIAPVSYFAGFDIQVETLVVPNTFTAVSSYLSRCSIAARSIVLSEGIMRIGAYAFAGNDAVSYTIPSTIQHIGMNAFSCCGAGELDLSKANDLTASDIEVEAFTGCPNLRSIKFGRGFYNNISNKETKMWLRSVLSGCDKLQEIVLGEGSRKRQVITDKNFFSKWIYGK